MDEGCHDWKRLMSKLPLPGKEMFGGTPNMARETHALPAQGVVAFWRSFGIVSGL
jgi:hypothetical protein